MKPAPQGWPRISSVLFYDDPRAAIDWLSRAFGFETRLLVEGDAGRIEHCEMTFGEGMVMIGQSAREQTLYQRSPRSLEGANTQTLCIHVDDVDAHCARSRAAGARIVREPTTSDYGEDYWTDRSYEAVDPEEHHWYFMQRLRDPVR